MIARTIVPFALVALTALTVDALSARAKELPTAIPDGKPQSCIPLVGLESHVRDDRTIDFTSGRRAYRNVLPQSCPELGFEEAFSYRTSLSELCSTDIITVLHKGGGGIPGASCGLGEFQPIKHIR